MNRVLGRLTAIRASHAPLVERLTSSHINPAMANPYHIVSKEELMRRTPVAVLVVLIFLSITGASAQLTIDATGEFQGRRREPSTGSSGSIGRKLPMRVAIEMR